MPPPGYGAMMPGQCDNRYSPYGCCGTPYGPPGGGPQLPPGWESATDPSSGKMYYFNRATGETTWTVPTSSSAGGDASGERLPEGWEKTIDKDSGKPYYFNR